MGRFGLGRWPWNKDLKQKNKPCIDWGSWEQGHDGKWGGCGEVIFLGRMKSKYKSLRWYHLLAGFMNKRPMWLEWKDGGLIGNKNRKVLNHIYNFTIIHINAKKHWLHKGNEFEGWRDRFCNNVSQFFELLLSYMPKKSLSDYSSKFLFNNLSIINNSSVISLKSKEL